MDALTPDTKLSAPALLHLLELAGIKLYLQDGALRYDAPKGAMTVPLMAQVKAQKDRLVQLLGPYPPMVCFACGEDIHPGAPAGQGPLWTNLGLFHIATCLPPGLVYNPRTGMVERGLL